MPVTGEQVSTSQFRDYLWGWPTIRASVFSRYRPHRFLLALSTVQQLRPIFADLQARKPEYKPLRMRGLFDDWVRIRLSEFVAWNDEPGQVAPPMPTYPSKWVTRRDSAIRANIDAVLLFPNDQPSLFRDAANLTLDAMNALTPDRRLAYPLPSHRAMYAVTDAAVAYSHYYDISTELRMLIEYNSDPRMAAFWDRLAADANNAADFAERLGDPGTPPMWNTYSRTLAAALAVSNDDLHTALRAVLQPGASDLAAITTDMAVETGTSVYDAARKFAGLEP